MKALLNRFKEPSSYAGFAAIIALVGLNLDTGQIQSIVYLFSGIAGVVAMIMPEDKVVT